MPRIFCANARPPGEFRFVQIPAGRDGILCKTLGVARGGCSCLELIDALPSTSGHEIFSENHAGKFITMLPKEIQLDQKFHWEMALVELFWPKQDSVVVIENLWYEAQGPNRRWKRTYVPSSAFLSVTSLFIT